MSEERKDYAVLISLATREEAEVAAAALRADGIDAFIGNSHHVYTNWHYTIALGGLQVFVPRQQLADAKAAVRERLRDNADNCSEESLRRRDRWKLWTVVASYLLLGWFFSFASANSW